MRTISLLFVLGLLAVISTTGHARNHHGYRSHGGRRLLPCQRGHHRANITHSGGHNKSDSHGHGDKGPFGDEKTSRINDMHGMFFIDKTYRSEIGQWKYSLSTYYLDKPRAAATCQKMGGQLAHITSVDKYRFLKDWLETLRPYDGQQIHIGGRLNRNMTWTEDNGSELPFLVWHVNEPSVDHTDDWQELCLLLERRNGKFKMNDVRCRGIWKRFLCEEHTSV